jgi:hypothetical protein
MQSDDDDQLKQSFFSRENYCSICYLVMPIVVSPSGTLRFRTTRQRPNLPGAKCYIDLVQSTDAQRRKELNVMLPITND